MYYFVIKRLSARVKVAYKQNQSCSRKK